MKNNIWMFAIGMMTAMLLSSCAETYVVSGTTNVHGLEGKTLYLKVFEKDNLANIDSCTITHGKFAFRVRQDSVEMANIFVGEQSLIPVVLEEGNIKVTLETVGAKVEGGALNDTLYKFIQEKTRLDNLISELPRKEGRMVMDGMDHDQVLEVLSAEYSDLAFQSDELVTSFIKANYHNVLGPGVFMIMTSGLDYPVLTPMLEELLTNAPASFLNDPYVRTYVKQARENMDIIQAQ